MKVLFLQEYIRDTHIVKRNGELVADYLSTSLGRRLIKYAKDIGIKRADVHIDYAYDMIPEVMKIDPRTGRVIKYKEPSLSMRKIPESRLMERILALKPDIIIPMGNIGCRFLLGVQAITRLRGRPEQITLNVPDTTGVMQTYDTWVLPIYSMEYIMSQPNAERFVSSDMSVLQKFLKQGESAYIMGDVSYEFVTTYERVEEIFTQFKTPRNHLANPHWLVAWDLETNTLQAEMLGAKALVISLSWAHGQGVTIPLEHKDFTWEPGVVDKIYELIRDFQEDRSIYKVGHNIGFDIRFLMSTRGFTYFHNNMDTKVAYYLAISQDVSSSLRLSDMAYELTDMGGYDTPLEEYKINYRKEYNAKEKERIEEVHKQALAQYEIDVKAHEEEEAKRLKAHTDEGKPLKLFTKRPKPAKPKKPKPEPLTNEIDGSNFNYEWIPLELMHPYASGDVDSCLRIHHKLAEELQKHDKWWHLYSEYYPRLTQSLSRVESTGLETNLTYMEDIDREYGLELEEITRKLRELEPIKEFARQNEELYAMSIEHFVDTPPKERDPELVKLRTNYRKNGVEFRPTAPDDKRRVLFDILGIRPPYDRESVVESAWDVGKPEQELTWKDYKGDKHNLEYIRDNYPEHRELATLLLEYSKVGTLKSNFTTALLKRVSNKDGRVHGNFNSTGTETSRLSSDKPNLQNIPSKVGDPKRFDYKYPIKRMFTSRFENGGLIEADFQALEMRVAGLRAKDLEMTRAFLNKDDLHTETAMTAFGLAREDVTPDLRQKAKGVSFGLLYGEINAVL